MIDKQHNKRFAQQFLLISLFLVGAMIFYSMKLFTGSFLGAVILYVLFRPFMERFTRKKNWNKNLVAIGIILSTFLLIITPILLTSFMIVPKLTLFFRDGSMTMQVFYSLDARINELTGYNLITSDTIDSLREKAGGFITGFLSGSMLILSEIALMYLFLFYFLINTGNMESFLQRHLPFSEQNINKFSKELEVQTFSNSLGAPLLAVLQGIVAILGYWIFGLPEPVFWGSMTGLFSFVPVIGSMLIWLPAAIFQISTGETWQGVAILLFGGIVISSIDNIFRFIFQKKFANVHPLVTIIGVIVGLQLFGFPGIIFGPLLISYFIILLKIFKQEFIESGKE
ncbi:MAG TPA: AI-2E family transporter [Bacteroidia bacterium]|nr:AI-2E family transporter [Bacteroidia bacterium]HNS12559.1 AI-2E family transporter [Bacteroidia bacterium]